MQRVLKSVLVAYSARRMFDLVDDVERYPEFLPWCGGARIMEVRADGSVAEVRTLAQRVLGPNGPQGLLPVLNALQETLAQVRFPGQAATSRIVVPLFFR